MDGCLENSTECLLRAILAAVQINNSAGFDWNPLNFAFTAAIGVLALVIACITVFQGLLAAGPGRVKSSKAVIGPWSVYTRRRFDWDEFGFRSTAFVPIISWQTFQNYFLYEINLDELKQPKLLQDADTSTSWLLLLSTFGLAYPDLFPCIPRATDYLPSDIQAAPAAAEVRCLAMLAALADENVIIEDTDRFPSVIGNSSQLTFREHPILGVVAAYERFTSDKAPRLRRGRIDEFNLGLKTQSNDQLPESGLRYAPPTSDIKPGEKTPVLISGLQTQGVVFSSQLRFAIGDLEYAGRKLHFRRFPQYGIASGDVDGLSLFYQDLDARKAGCGHAYCVTSLPKVNTAKMRRESLFNAIVLLVATAPVDCRAFPKSNFDLVAAVGTLFSVQPQWMEDNLSIIATISTAVKSLGTTFEIYESDETYSPSWLNTETSHTPWPRRSGHRSNKCDLLAFAEFLAPWSRAKTNGAAIQDNWLLKYDDGSSIRFNTQLRGRPYRTALLDTLHCLDRWLSTRVGNEIGCATLHLLYDLHVADGLLEPLSNASSKTEDADAKRDVFVDKDINEGLRAILIYRAVLFAALLDQCNDTSPLFNRNFKNSVVKVL